MHPQHGKGLTFSEALEQLKDGRKLQRQSWIDKGQYQWVVRQVGYPQGITLNHGTAQATGLPEGSIQVFEPYFMMYTPWSTFVPWTASTGDLNADDWEVFYMPGEYERLCQEETDAAIAEDPTLAAELEADGKDLRTYSHEEVKMVLGLRALEREDLPDREAIRFRLIDQLLKPIFDHQRQLDLANHPLPLETVSPQVASMMNAFVGVITRLNDDLTQTKLVLDRTQEKIDGLEKFEEIWDAKYPVPDGLDLNDAIRAYQRIRYFQDGWKDSAGFTQTTWRLIATLLAPMLEEWRWDHLDTVGDYDLDRFKVVLNGSRIDGVDTIGHMLMELLPPVTDEQVKAMEAALERLGDPEATQRVVRPGDPGYPQRPQRLTDRFPLRATFGAAESGEEDPAEGRRMIRRAAPDAEPTQVAKYFLSPEWPKPQEEVTEEEYRRVAKEEGEWVEGEPLPTIMEDGDLRGHIEFHPQ